MRSIQSEKSEINCSCNHPRAIDQRAYKLSATEANRINFSKILGEDDVKRCVVALYNLEFKIALTINS